MRLAGIFLATSAIVAPAAIAGETVIYADPPDWVEIAQIDGEARSSNAPLVLLDQQARIEEGQLWTYVETAIALDSPQALTQFGTLSAGWQPDKGDLIIHRAQLLRGDEVIDLLADGSEFEVLRREQQLESRILNGVLTATKNVSGAQIGDIVRLAYSTTLRDQAMGDQVQWQSGLPADPAPIEDGRIMVSWPSNLPVSRVRLGNADVAEPVEKDGYFVWQADLPVAEPDEVPGDSPYRYQAGEIMQVSTYADWQSVSSKMAVHYSVEDAIAPNSELAGEIQAIAAASTDELTRSAMALELVQDKISYLLNGLAGGNYLPQSPAETWEKRFGDCKAKSVLLLAILQELGIESEVVLVRSRAGDTLPMMAPMPGAFDHMIVRAEIGGETYWLDGTVSGTRIDTIGSVPRFHYALPLRTGGAELIPLAERLKTTPDQVVRITMDQSAGLRVPALINVEIEFRGMLGGQWRGVADQADDATIESTVDGTVQRFVKNAEIVERSLNYDSENGVAKLTARGIGSTPWQRDRSVYELEAPAQTAKNIGFNSDRARAAWRDIPLRLNGPLFHRSEFTMLLPDEGSGFEIDGASDLSDTIGGVGVSSEAKLEGDTFSLSQTLRSVLVELPASEISTAKRALTRFDRALPVVKAPKDIRQPWDYRGKDRKRLAKIEEVYAQAIEFADPDEGQPFINRASFLMGIYDYKAALRDVEAALAIEESRALYSARSTIRQHLGNLEGALKDLMLMEDLQPDGSTYEYQVELLALLGRTDDAISLAEDYRGLSDSAADEDVLMATALGWAGDPKAGLELLEERLATRPGDGSLLNSICWHAGTWNLVNDDVLARCISAVEKSDYSAAAIDSRALAYFRLGNLEAAKADTDAALLVQPGMAASRLLRGIIRVAQGDGAGREEIDLALAMQPSMARTYAAWGLEF